MNDFCNEVGSNGILRKVISLILALQMLALPQPPSRKQLEQARLDGHGSVS